MSLSAWQLMLGILALSSGTYALRAGGFWLGGRASRVGLSSSLLNDAATILLFSVAVLSAVEETGQFAGWARVIGVLAGVGLVVCRRSLLEVIVCAASVTALIRYLGG